MFFQLAYTETSPYLKELVFFLPEIFLSLNILFILIYGVFLCTSRTYNFPLVQRVIYKHVLFALIGALWLLFEIPFVEQKYCFNHTLVIDYSTYFVKFFLYSSSLLCVVIGQPFLIKSRINNFEYFVMILCSILGLSILVSANDFISAYLAIELQALSFYVLASFQRKSVYSSEAGLKYFIVGVFSSGLMLFGMSLIFGLSGTTNLFLLKILYFESYRSMFILCVIFILMGLLFKLAAFPCHMWAPDVYEGAPLNSTIFFAVVPKLPILVFLVRFLLSTADLFEYDSAGIYEEIGLFLMFCGLGCLFVSSFGIITQDNLKRMLAYSSIGHIGFILLALSTRNFDGLVGCFTYGIFYVLISLPTWAIVVACMQKTHSLNSNVYLANLPGLFNAQPILALLCIFCFFSFAGIPPLIGFYAKLSVFNSIIVSDNLGNIELLCFIFILTLPSTFYYISIIKTLFFDARSDADWTLYEDLTKGFTALIVPFLIILVFVFPSVVYQISYLMCWGMINC